MLHGKMVIHDYQCLKITHPFCMHFHSLQHFQSIYQIYIPIFFIIELKWLAKTQCTLMALLFFQVTLLNMFVPILIVFSYSLSQVLEYKDCNHQVSSVSKHSNKICIVSSGPFETTKNIKSAAPNFLM